MKRILLAGVALLAFTWNVSAQNCTQTLRTARGTYEQGRLHEIPTILEDCFKKSEWSQSQRVEAYKILVLTYIYLEEPAKADEAMLGLLRTDHFFTPSETSDPIEFRSLYNKFRSAPIFQIGFKFGVNTPQVNVLKNHYIWANAQGHGEYTPKVSIQMGLVFEKNIFEKKMKNKLVINPEVFYSSAAFDYSNSNVSFTDDDAVENKDNMLLSLAYRRLQTNIMFQYKLGKSKLNPYLSLGPSFGYLIESTIAGEVITGTQITVPSIQTTDNYKALYMSAVLSAGVKYQIGSVYATADIRYQHGFGNMVKGENRYKPSEENVQLWNLGYVDNDFSLNQAMFNIGIIIPYFKPKKLIK
jgi:hypothetical protein